MNYRVPCTSFDIDKSIRCDIEERRLQLLGSTIRKSPFDIEECMVFCSALSEVRAYRLVGPSQHMSEILLHFTASSCWEVMV
jgi:hypothetical protein